MRAQRAGLGRVAVAAVALACVWAPRASAQRLLADGVRDLAEQIAVKAKEQQKLRVAVLPFRALEGQATVLGTFLAEELFTHLVNSGLEIVERSMLDKVLGEIKFDQTGVVDAATAKQVGKVIGVDAVVTGSITDLQSYIAINCRLIDASTGRVFAAAQTKIVKDDDVRKVMGAALPGTVQSSKPATPDRASAARPSPPPAATMVREAEGFRFELKGCAVSGTIASCDLLITNQEEDRSLQLLSRNSRLVDEEGNEVSATSTTLGSKNTNASTVTVRLYLQNLASGIAMRSGIRFEGVHASTSKASLLELSCSTGRKYFTVQFRDVPLARR